LQHGKDVQNVARVDHLVYGKTLDNGNCKNRIKFVIYQQNTGHQQFDFCRNTCRSQAHATQLARANPVAAQSSAVLPSSMQNSEAGHADNTNSRILPQTSMSQTTESVGLQYLSFTGDDGVLHILFESSNDTKFGQFGCDTIRVQGGCFV